MLVADLHDTDTGCYMHMYDSSKMYIEGSVLSRALIKDV
jgi:hypothetical protein